MKVFSLEKFIELEYLGDAKPIALSIGWPQACDGKTKEECGNRWIESCAVDTVDLDNLMINMKCETTPYKDTATIKGSKLEYHLLPPEQLAGMAQIMNHGESTHITGYMELDPLLYWNAVYRHLMGIRMGETTDEEGNSHALAIACNGMILDRQLKAGKELRFEK